MATHEQGSRRVNSRKRRRIFGAVSMFTATAMLTTLASAPSTAHDVNIINAENRPNDYEVMTWKDTFYGASLPDVIVATTYFTDDDYDGTCYGVVSQRLSFRNDTSDAQKKKMRTVVDAAFDNRRMGGSNSQYPTPSYVKQRNGTYRVAWRTPRSSASLAACPDVLNPREYSRAAVTSARSLTDLEKFAISYSTIGGTFAIAGIIGAAAGIALPSGVSAVAVGGIIGCLAGAVGQMIIRRVNVDDTWDETGKKMATACFVDGSVGVVNAAAGAWLKGDTQAAVWLRHQIIDSIRRPTDRYQRLPDDLEAAVEVVTRVATDARS